MTNNPFGDSASEQKSRYLILLSAGKDNLSSVQSIVQNIKKNVDPKASPLWIDSKGLGIFVESPLVATSIWSSALSELEFSQTEALKDMVVIEIGKDWMARKDSTMTHWLATHVGSPRIAPREQLRRR